MAHTTVGLTVIISMLFGAAVIEVPRRYFSNKNGTTIDIHIIANLSNTITHQSNNISTINEEISRLRRHYSQILFEVNSTITRSLEEYTKWIFDNTNRTLEVNLMQVMERVQNDLLCVTDNVTKGVNLLRKSTVYSIFRFKFDLKDKEKLIQGITNQIQYMENASAEQSSEIENIKGVLNELNTRVNLTIEKFAKIEKQQSDLHFQHYTLRSELEFAHANSTPIETFQFTIFIMIVFEVFIALIVWSRLKSINQARQIPVGPPRKYANNNTEHHITGNQSPENQILTKVSRRSLQRSVCVLSFYSGTPHDKHLRVSRSFLDQGVKLEDFVVNRHEDILTVPESKVMLVHVDYNARNIILEDSSREIGDLRRTTVLALQKMGAEVVIFYYEEIICQPVEDGKLYNPQLESVKLHPVLKELESKQRVVSLPEGTELTEYQKHYLKNAVSSFIKC